MTESEFTQDLVAYLLPRITDARIGSGISVLYEMPIDDDGVVRVGVDADSGQPLRGRGTGFEQDILVYEEKTVGHTSIIPRVIVEVKFGRATTHDAIVYSYKAECIKRIYPFCRYGMVIGGVESIPPRVLRHGRNFDFVAALAYPIVPLHVQELHLIVAAELAASRIYGDVIRGRNRVRVLRRDLAAVS